MFLAGVLLAVSSISATRPNELVADSVEFVQSKLKFPRPIDEAAFMQTEDIGEIEGNTDEGEVSNADKDVVSNTGEDEVELQEKLALKHVALARLLEEKRQLHEEETKKRPRSRNKARRRERRQEKQAVLAKRNMRMTQPVLENSDLHTLGLKSIGKLEYMPEEIARAAPDDVTSSVTTEDIEVISEDKRTKKTKNQAVHSANDDDDDCLNVEDPATAAAEGRSGDNQCFGGDEIGMVCGWDGTDLEAYCELSKSGLKVCARRKSGGRCKKGRNTPITTKTHDEDKPAFDVQLSSELLGKSSTESEKTGLTGKTSIETDKDTQGGKHGSISEAAPDAVNNEDLTDALNRLHSDDIAAVARATRTVDAQKKKKEEQKKKKEESLAKKNSVLSAATSKYQNLLKSAQAGQNGGSVSPSESKWIKWKLDKAAKAANTVLTNNQLKWMKWKAAKAVEAEETSKGEKEQM